MSETVLPILIIGGGPAGYTAALYAARAGLQPVVYQGPQPGGQLTLTTEVENYPGYVQGVKGEKMMDDFQKQAQRFGADSRRGTVTAVDFSVYPHQVVIDHNQVYRAKAVIIATGAHAKWLHLPSAEKLQGKGISTCAICDGFFFKGQPVAVVGGGDSAAEEALYLSNLCPTVYLLVRETMRASTIMQQRIAQKPSIVVQLYTEVTDVIGTQTVEAIRIVKKATKAEEQIAVKGLFIAIGHQPNTALFAPYIQLDEQGYIVTAPGTTKTNVPGVFAAGDSQDRVYRQAITAAGTGCMAALDAERFLTTLPLDPTAI